MRWIACVLVVLLSACGGSESDELGVGAECTADDECNQDIEPPLHCLSGFKGGYCGLSNCTGDQDCPEDSICVHHTDGTNYCFRACTDKAECNANRDADNESNCSSNIDRVSDSTAKACVPPSG